MLPKGCRCDRPHTAALAQVKLTKVAIFGAASERKRRSWGDQEHREQDQHCAQSQQGSRLFVRTSSRSPASSYSQRCCSLTRAARRTVVSCGRHDEAALTNQAVSISTGYAYPLRKVQLLRSAPPLGTLHATYVQP